MLALQANPAGLVISPNLHDYEIRYLETSTETNQVSLLLAGERGDKIRFVISDATAVSIVGWSQQNVVLDVYLFCSELDTGYYQRARELLVDGGTESIDETKWLLYFEPSAGAELAILCGAVEITPA